MKINYIFLLSTAMVLFNCKSKPSVDIQGELKKWHRVTLVFDGPETSELAEVNPFLNYRLDVTFTKGDKNYVVPGFYAADGDAAETSAAEGNKWMVRFAPDGVGEWSYKVSFKQGENVAVANDTNTAKSAAFMDGMEGTFEVGATDKTGLDNRAKGCLRYVGEHYLKFAETGDYFIKVGVDAPENLFAYEDFDATPNALGFRKNWSPHAKDFEASASAYTWQEGKGQNLIGAIRYLASEELNVFSFLTFNIDGDDRNVFPYLLKVPQAEYETYASDKKNKEAWETYFHKTRFDISKLEQWERILDYAETQGMFLHFKTHETETDHLMDKGVFGTEMKLYYRELIARFGHHLAMNWNLGEENNQPISEVVKAANYVHNLDPYQHHLVIHTFPNQDARYGELIGDQSPLTGASLQLSDKEFKDVHERVLKWRMKSDSTGKKWALSVDEPGSARYALLPDEEDAEHDNARARALYGTLMASGFGVEWYFGYDSPNSDLTCQDFRSRDLFWDQNRYARQFFEQQIPFYEMRAADELTQDELSYCLAKKGEVYAILLPKELQTTSLDLSGTDATFTIEWYNPRQGSGLLEGTIAEVEGGNESVGLGLPPSEIDMDWMVLLKRK
ncbi:MAG: DUF5060 domain-containing protein [Bacteroidota bacterium]